MAKRSTQLKHYFLKEVNPVIRFLILSDTAIVGAAGLLGPIFAIFIEDFIIGGNEAVAGIATGLYLFSRSFLQIPIAYLLDKIRGEKDDFWLMFIFTTLTAFTPLLYLLISTPLELYFIQVLMGVFTAFTYPAYMAIFTRHIDRNKEGMEWSIYYTLTDLISAILAMLGGYLALTAGFPTLIISVVLISLLGSFLIFPIRQYIK